MKVKSGMKKERHLFNVIAPVYGLFYRHQKKRFHDIINKVSKYLDLTVFNTVIDVGCGTGALCAVLDENGLSVTGVDPAEKMLNIARRKTGNKNISFISGNALKTLPFDDKCFDISFASYVAHGMQRSDRNKLYKEMSRITKNLVIIHDYNQNRALLTTIIEWLEKGDYFHFIKEAENEMRNCTAEMKECFSEVRVVDVAARAAWYICVPN